MCNVDQLSKRINAVEKRDGHVLPHGNKILSDPGPLGRPSFHKSPSSPVTPTPPTHPSTSPTYMQHEPVWLPMLMGEGWLPPLLSRFRRHASDDGPCRQGSICVLRAFPCGSQASHAQYLVLLYVLLGLCERVKWNHSPFLLKCWRPAWSWVFLLQ